MRFSKNLFSRMGMVQFPTKKITGAQIIYQKLIEKNVKDVFLYSGGSIMPLVDCFYQGHINYYINTHEQNCGHAATGYAKSSDRVGVVITTSGPGITNMITPILDAQNDSTPMVVISGQVGLNVMGTDAFQEAPATEITKPCTKWSYCIQNIEEIPEVMDYAFYLAQDGKQGVVHLDLPKCVSTTEIDEYIIYEKKKEKQYQSYFIEDDYYFSQENGQLMVHRNYYDELIDQVKEVAEIINKSRKPIFYIGQGCAAAHTNLKKVIYKNRIPCTTTIHGKGIFPEKNIMSLQWCGMHGLPAANYALQESDCIIAVGSRFDDRTTGNIEKYAPIAREKKQIIHVDIEESQFNKSLETNYNIKAHSNVFLEILLEYIREDIRLDWMTRLAQLKNQHKFKYQIPPDNKINVPQVITTIDKYLQKNDSDYYISTGVGNHQMMTYQFIEGKRPKKIHSSGSLGVMGAGLPYAVGIQLANPNSLVIDIDGDSSFMMTLGDLKTIREYDLPVKIAIMNDSRQMMVNIWEKLFFEERYTATVNTHNPDFGTLAESFGLTAFKCENSDDLEETTRNFLDYPGAALCEYKVEPEICLPLVGPGKALDEMILFDQYHSENMDLKKNKYDKSQVPS